MPEHLICNQDDLPKYAKIADNGKSLTWGAQDVASGFPTTEAARLAFDTACDAMFRTAHAKAAKAEKDLAAAGFTINPSYGHVPQTFSHKSRNTWFESVVEHYLPWWLCSAWKDRSDIVKVDGLDSSLKLEDAPTVTANESSSWSKDLFPYSSRATLEDLLGVFDVFYVRSAVGWLSRSELKRQAGQLTYQQSFGLAVAFNSRQAAQAVMSERDWIVQSSSVFTKIETSPCNESSDALASAIGAACEARDIRQSLEENVKERMAAMNEPKTPSRKSRI